MRPGGIIFWDWNGTLMDDVEYTRGCLNWLLARYGYAQRYDLAAYREIFGFPIEEYYRRAGFDFERQAYAVLAQSFMDRYNVGVSSCPVMAGAPAALAALQAAGWAQAVLSVSPRDSLTEQVTARGLGGYFTELLGQSDIYGVSKVQAGLDWLRKSGIDPAACVMIGDTDHDAQVAGALGAKCVLFTGGHQSRRRLEAACANVTDDLAGLPGIIAAL